MKTLLILASTVLAITVSAAETTPAPGTSLKAAKSASAPQQHALAELRPFASPEAMQAEFVRRFEASPGFGLSRVIRPVFLAPIPTLVWNGTTYRIVPPNLIGLEDEPVAYTRSEFGHRAWSGTATNVTRREIRKMFEHRPLTDLETGGVTALRAGRDLVVVTNRVVAPDATHNLLAPAPDLLVFGALRANRDCAACHQCPQGSLLGAFAYTLSPIAETNAPATRSNLVARVISGSPAAGVLSAARSRL